MTVSIRYVLFRYQKLSWRWDEGEVKAWNNSNYNVSVEAKASNDAIRVTIVSSNAPQALKPHPWVRQIGAKSASSPPRPKSAPRGSKSTTFARGIIQSFHLPNFLHNPIGDPSVLPIQYPIYLWLQAAAWEAFGIGRWYLVSCTSKQISKFTVQA